VRHFISFFFIAIFFLPHANAAEKDASIVAAFLAKNGWELSRNKMNFAAPVADIVPIHFFSKGAKSPSCGLLVQKASELNFIEILMSESEDLYPHCASIKEAVSFRLADRLYLLFIYTEKDTRDEIYDRFFFVYRDQDGLYHVEKELNESEIPVELVRKNSKRVGLHGTWHVVTAEDGIRLAKATFVRNTAPSLNFLDRDFISSRGNSFSVLKDRKQQKCLFVVENDGNFEKFSSDLFTADGKCVDFLASSQSKKGEKTFFLGIFEGIDKSRNIAVFSVTPNGQIRDERELALLIRNSGKTGNVKSAKAYLHEIAK